MAFHTDCLTNYQIVGCIGKGTYGTVLLCSKLPHNEPVVVKEVSFNQTESVESSKETENEIRVLSNLSHPFIIQYYESFCDRNFAYISMEYATNGNLAGYMLKRHHYLLPQNEILYFFCQILLGVQYIHGKNIIHRDLKAENILLSGPHGTTVKICDFGIAKILDKHGKASTVIGTPYYLAPELCESKPYCTKTDVWALGCLLYEMCTHKRAFDSETLVGLVNQIVSGNIMPINTCFYDPDIQQTIDGMLTVVPEKRCSVDDLIKRPALRPTVEHLEKYVKWSAFNAMHAI